VPDDPQAIQEDTIRGRSKCVLNVKKGLDTKRRDAILIKRIYKTTPTFSWNIPIIGGFFYPPNGSIKAVGVFENVTERGVTTGEESIAQG
jgi:hypothetical protein